MAPRHLTEFDKFDFLLSLNASPDLSVQLEQGDVVIQRLRVVVVVDVGGGDSQGLRALRPVLGGQIMVADPHIDGVT